jgi:hypothetical protein
MKSNRAWLVIVTCLVLVIFTSLAAQAAPLCEDLCNCIKKCTVRCTPTPPLPVLSCGEWGYECAGSPLCTGLTSASTLSSSSSSGDIALLAIFSDAPSVPSPAEGPASR